jgi:hypothetical protein
MPHKYKTLLMSIKYLKNSENSSLNVPIEHIKNSQLINKVVPYNGMIIQDVPYKLKTYEICMKAVKNTGIALCYVPLKLITIDMCFMAIYNTAEAYIYVPYIYKTKELKDLYVKKYMYTIINIDADDVTHNMLLTVLKDEYVNSYIGNINYNNKNIRDIITKHFIEYVNINTIILEYIPFELIYENWDNMKYAIEIDKNIFNDNYEKFKYEHIIELVKYGIDFCYIPTKYVTLELLDELVEARSSIINELPVHCIHDGLYKICMIKHDMKLNEIPDEYRTEMILHIANELHPETMYMDNNNCKSNDINGIELLDMRHININNNINLIDKIL